MTRIGDFIQCFSGNAFWPLDPRADEIDIVDIAHSLSMQCRYGGHALAFYSVAEHSVLLSRWLAEQGHSVETQLWGLLHDAAEAYLVDVPRPIKPALDGYREIEERVMVEVCRKFALPFVMPDAVKDADIRICVDEKAQNMAPGLIWGLDGLQGLGVTLCCYEPYRAERWFMARYRRLVAESGRSA